MDIFTDIHSGRQFCMKSGNPTADHMLKNGIFEYDLIRWCEQFLTSNGVFVDIGAHIGTYSVLLSKKCKEVISFEPQKDTFDCLNVGLCINDCHNIKAYNVALSSQEGTLTLHHVSKDGGGSSLRSDILNTSNQAIIGEEPVSVKTLDSYELENIEFMKLDVEGNELEVIKGAIKTLVNSRFPPFIFEAWKDDWYRTEREALIHYIRKLGYKVHPITGYSNMFLAADHSLRNRHEEKQKEEEKPKHDIPLLIKKYEDKEVLTWEEWHALARHYRVSSKYSECYDCIIKGLECSVPDGQKFLFYEDLSFAAFYLGKMSEGYDACDKVILSPYAPWGTRNQVLSNQGFYMEKIQFKEVIPVKFDLPEGYIGSSSSIVKQGDDFLINLRSVNYSINSRGGYIIRDPEEIVRTRNFLLTVDSNFDIKHNVELCDVSGIPRYPKNILGLEDIRLFSPTQLQCTYLEVNESRTPQICYCEYDSKTGEVTKILPLMVGTEIKCEKNWLPFKMEENAVHFIYKESPLQIYRLDLITGEFVQVINTIVSGEHGHLDDFRGSGGLIEYKGGWLGTVHQVYHSDPRKYFHRFIWFDKQFTLIKFSKIFFFEAPVIEFTLSLCHSEKGLLVPYSQNDNSSKIGVLDYETLDQWLEL